MPEPTTLPRSEQLRVNVQYDETLAAYVATAPEYPELKHAASTRAMALLGLRGLLAELLGEPPLAPVATTSTPGAAPVIAGPVRPRVRGVRPPAAMAQQHTWATIARPKNPYACPYCATGFVVESMTEYHMLNNQCGLVPANS